MAAYLDADRIRRRDLARRRGAPPADVAAVLERLLARSWDPPPLLSYAAVLHGLACRAASEEFTVTADAVAALPAPAADFLRLRLWQAGLPADVLGLLIAPGSRNPHWLANDVLRGRRRLTADNWRALVLLLERLDHAQSELADILPAALAARLTRLRENPVSRRRQAIHPDAIGCTMAGPLVLTHERDVVSARPMHPAGGRVLALAGHR